MLSCIEDNEARLIGYVCSEPEHSHEVHGEKFCRFCVKAERLSENEDMIIVTAPESIISGANLKVGTKVCASGQFRSYNNYSGMGNKLVLTLFAREIIEAGDSETANEIYLNGFVCKEIIYRVTPFGREIADILLAVNRAYNKSDYIPCIAWGRNARLLKNIGIGRNLKIWGRMQSREYQKKTSETQSEVKTAYEVSVSKIEIAASEQDGDSANNLF